MNIIELFEDANTMSLWHGGRGLEYSYSEMRPHKKGQWEHGPGLYLTTHYDTAAQYAKGGGSVYSVTIKYGTEISSVSISLEKAIEFVKRNSIQKFQKEIIADLNNVDNRNKTGNIPIGTLVNLCLNYDALSTKNTINLRKFLVENGVDYEISRGYGGRNETIVIVFNPKIIQNVKVVRAPEVTDTDRIKII